MALDNGLAYRQSDSHAVFLCRIEAFEESVCGLRLETDSHIFHSKAHLIFPISIGRDDQVSRTIMYRAHRIGSIPKQVQGHLLKLDAIARDPRELISKVYSPSVVPTDSSIPVTLIDRTDIAMAPGASRTNSLAMVTNYTPGSYVTHDQLHIRGGHQTSWLNRQEKDPEGHPWLAVISHSR